MILIWGLTQEQRTKQFEKESGSLPIDGDSWAFDDGVWHYKNGKWYFQKTDEI